MVKEVDVLFVNARFLTQNITGVQRFAIEISLWLKRILKDNIRFVAPKNIIHIDVAKELDVICIGNLQGYLWEQLELPRFLVKRQNPLLLNLANMAPVFYKNKVTVIHSLSFLNKEWNSFLFHNMYKFLIPLIIKNSKFIFTVSNYTKQEILSYYKNIYNLHRNIDVIYNSYIVRSKNNIVSNIFNGNIEEYILYVGSVSKSKNIVNLIEAINNINSKNKKILLYIVGGCDQKIFRSSDIASNEYVRFVGQINDENILMAYYQNATAFIFPSLYESFGIPPIEAQACGCPVLCSGTTSLPEICGSGALYFDPTNIYDIETKIELILDNKNLQNELRAKGFENIKRFSWEESAHKIINLVNKL
jgi:group 1 glycosyl transferase